MKSLVEMTAQQIGQTVVQKAAQNPQATIATGVAAAKAVGALAVAAAPYVAAAAVGGAIGYGIVWGLGKIFGD